MSDAALPQDPVEPTVEETAPVEPAGLIILLLIY